jgi:glycerol uptake facilitator-like aquaporin
MLSNLAIKNRRTLFVFEAMGTMFLTIMIRLLLQEIKLTIGFTATIPFFFAYWMITMLTIKISGAHYNPMISLIAMFQRGNEDNFPKALGALYIAGQFLGAFVGSLIAWFLTGTGG